MKANISRAVKKYRSVEIFDAINEAIINGVQANASKLDVKLNYDADDKLQSIEIQDDGVVLIRKIEIRLKSYTQIIKQIMDVKVLVDFRI